MCHAADPAPQLNFIYKSIDHREINNSRKRSRILWAFGVSAILENSVLLDQPTLSQNLPFWSFTNTTLSLSEQWIISNVWGFSDYCVGGSFESALDYINNNFPTVEISVNYPYSYTTHQSIHYANTALSPII